jgi:uncharacterized membrane protein YagU involved in acid resistance
MSAVSAVQQAGISKGAVRGAAAGVAGGVVFGIMMGAMGMLPMVAMLVGSQSAVVGAVVHLVISAVIGAIYGTVVVLGRFQLTTAFALISGAVNGIVWWVLGALILMPLGLGMTEMVFKVGEAQWMSLLGHLIFGVITGLVLLALNRRG